MTPSFIAICGSKRSGKDTVANIISELYGHKNFKIATKLKDVCRILFGFSEDQVESDSKDVIDPEWDITPRQAMQYIGTEIMQYKIQELLGYQIGRELWIRSFIKTISKEPLVVVSDLRFMHEYKHIKKMDGLIIRIINSDIDNDIDKENNSHISEREFQSIPADITIDNSNHPNIERLKAQVIQKLESFVRL